MSQIIPIERQILQLENSKDNGTQYWENAMYLAQTVFKCAVAGILSSLEEDADHTTYDHEYELVRANSEGRWCEILMALETSETYLHCDVRDIEMQELSRSFRKDSWQYDAVEYLRLAGRIFGLDKNRESFALSPSKANLMQWFRLFPEIRNGVRGHNSVLGTDDAKEREAAEYLEKSVRLVYENFNIFKRDWIYIRPEKNNRNFVRNLQKNPEEGSIARVQTLESSSQASLREGVYICFNGSVKRVNMIFAFDEGNLFYFPNGGVNKSTFEIICYANVDDRLKKNDINAYSNPPKVKALSHTSGCEETYELNFVITNLPRLNELYVKRPKLEGELAQYISYEDRSPIVVLKGIGGTGKTSLALNAARTIAQKKRFDFIWWFSARDVDLLVDGVKDVRPDVVSRKDMATLYCRLVGFSSLDTNLLIEEFQTALSGPDRVLFIFDNFETVSGFKDVFEFLLANIRCPNKVIITTRDERFYKYDRSVVDVMGMEMEECNELINKYAEKYEINVRPDLIKQIFEQTNGHPYLIKLLLNDYVNNAKIGKMTWGGKKERLLDQLCTRTFDSLSIEEKWVFLVLCNIQGSVYRFILDGILQGEKETADISLDEVLSSLQRCSFIECIETEEDPGSFNLLINSEGDFNLITVPSIVAEYGKAKLKMFSMIVEDGEEVVRDICRKIDGFGKMNDPSLKGAKCAIEKKLMTLTKKGDVKGWIGISGEVAVIEELAKVDSDLQRHVAKVYEQFNCVEGAKRCYENLIQNIENAQDNYRDWRSLAALFDDGTKEQRVAWQKMVQNNYARKRDVCEIAEKLVIQIQNNRELTNDPSYKKNADLCASRLIEFEGQADFFSKHYEYLCWLLYFLGRDKSEIRPYIEKGKKASNMAARFSRLEALLNG